MDHWVPTMAEAADTIDEVLLSDESEEGRSLIDFRLNTHTAILKALRLFPGGSRGCYKLEGGG